MPKRKMHPKSLENLTHDGRPQVYDEEKKRRYRTVTETGWSGVKAVAQTAECSGISDLLEKLGRGELLIQNPRVNN